MIPLVLIGARLLALALACGINLYATIAVLGLAIRFDLVDPLPPALIGLEQWLLIGGALALLLVELVASAMPHADEIWEAFHSVVRPVAAIALAFLALEAAPLPIRAAGTVVAGAAAFAAHVTKFGLRRMRPSRWSGRFVFGPLESLAAVVLAVAALVQPVAALAVVAVVAVILARLGPGPWRVAAFSTRASLSWLRGFFGGRQWQPRTRLPASLRGLVRAAEEGLPAPRLAPAALSGDVTGAYRSGWLVFDGNAAAFVYRRSFQPRRLDLTRPTDAVIRHDWLADILEVRLQDRTYTLHLLKEGPPAEITLGALQLVVD